MLGANEMMMAGCIVSGAIFGDNLAPISDTTILASAGAQCVHIEHVSTQFPYALLVASACGVGYLLAGILHNPYIGWIVGLVVLCIILAVITICTGKEDKKDRAGL